MVPPATVAALVVGALATAGCGAEAPAVRLVPIDRPCGKVADPRGLLVTPLGALAADRQLVTPGAPVALDGLPADTRQLSVEVLGEGGITAAIGKTAPFVLDELADGDELVVAMGPPDGVCPAGALLAPRHHAAVALAGDDVLVLGGRDGAPLATAELYDPDTETSRAVTVPPALMQGDLGLTGAALATLPGGKVALVGGPQPGLAVFDAATGAFAAPVLTGTTRAHHAAVALDERRVLVVGGCAALLADGGCAPASGRHDVSIVDVVDGSVTPGPQLLLVRLSPSVIVEDGRDGVRRFLVVGGHDGAGAAVPGGQRLELGTDTSAADHLHGLGAAAAALDSGAILTAFAPGGTPPGGLGAVLVPGSGIARPLAGTPARAGAQLVTLEDGQLLAVGGGPPVRFHPAAGTWRGVPGAGDLDLGAGVSAVRLADGTVLVIGGEVGGDASAAVWRFRPRLLGPFGAAHSVVPGDVASDPPLTPLDPTAVVTSPDWQLTAGNWAIAGGLVGSDLRLEWTGALGDGGATLLFGFVDAGRHHRAELVPGQPVRVVGVDGAAATVRCEGAAVQAPGATVARVEPTADGVQIIVGGRTLVRCALGELPAGRVGVGALGAGGVTIETLAVTR